MKLKQVQAGQLCLYGENFNMAINCNWKPFLRKLSDMTEEEDKECYKIMFGEFQDKVMKQHITHYEGEKIRYLLSKHFDLFGLIESGVAVDKTKLQNG